MLDDRWTELREKLVEAGWVCRDDTLFAPHHTLWFSPSSRARDLVVFRERLSVHCDYARRAVEEDGADADEYRELLEDLVSLIAAVDRVLGQA